MTDLASIRLLASHIGHVPADQCAAHVFIAPQLRVPPADVVPRRVLAHALTLALFHDLLQRVPVAQILVDEAAASGRQVVFDHGALRTVAWPSGALAAGEAAVARVLRPLGFAVAGTYPLPRLGMTGRAWRHLDAPEDIAQFFVSELHPERFSPQFQQAVTRVLAPSSDPLDGHGLATLSRLEAEGELRFDEAAALLPRLAACFQRHHPLYRLDDHELLLAESPEMAWIATEGQVFNHATDRVTGLEAIAAAQRRAGRPIKDSVEVSASGRVRQTAFRAASVQRDFLSGTEVVTREVPGSFYELIERLPVPSATPQASPSLDLAFDAANATGIFAMTRASDDPASPVPQGASAC